MLTINFSKTNFMVFSKIKSSKNYKLSINNHLICKIDSIKLLGVFIDSRLTKRHIKYVSSKLRKVSFLLYKASRTLDEICFNT